MADGRLYISPSQLKSFLACERRWYLESQAGAARDAEAGGQYLVFGRLLDEAVERYVADPRVVLAPGALVATVQAARRGDELSTVVDEKWLELADRAVRQLRRLAVARLLPPTGTSAQHRYRVDVPGVAVTLVGRADFRAPGRIWDIKSTSDRGPGQGPSAERRPNALTDETLRDDVQTRIYAVAEFLADPMLASVSARWVYASSTTTAVWAATTFFTRAETLAWFDEHIRPLLPRMLELAASEGLAPEEARANPDACRRCFVRGACSPYDGAQYPPEKKEYHVDLEKLRARQRAVNRPAAASAPAPENLEAQLRASLVVEAAAVADGTRAGRLADDEPALATQPVFETSGYEADDPKAPGPVALAGASGVENPSVSGTPSAPPAAPSEPSSEPSAAPKRGRGRPRKTAEAAAAATASARAWRAPTAEELALIEGLDASARLLNAQREALAEAVVHVLDAASAARNALRAVGVRFEGDPS